MLKQLHKPENTLFTLSTFIALHFLFKDGELVHFVERHHIEGRSAEMIAENLKAVYEEFC